MDELKALQAFYDGYMEFIGEDADEVHPDALTLQDRATIAGLQKAVQSVSADSPHTH